MRFTTNRKYEIKDDIEDEYFTAKVVFEIEKEDLQDFILDYFKIKYDREQVLDLLDSMDVNIEDYIYEIKLQDDLYEWCQDNEIDIKIVGWRE